MNYKKIPAICTAILVMAAASPFDAMGLTSYGADVNNSDDGVTIYRIVPDGESSEYGLTDYKIVDSEGNEFKPFEEYGVNVTDKWASPDSAGNGLLPSYFNLCDEGRVTLVKNQNPYGTCWAHAALASAESNMITKGYADQNIDYSEKHLVWFTQGDCSEVQSPDDPTYHDTYTWDSNIDPYNIGAFSSAVSSSLCAWKGAELEENSPYSTIDTEYMVDESKRYDSYAHLQNVLQIDGSYEGFFCGKDNINAVKRMLIDHGALYCSYWDDSSCYNPLTYGYYNNKNNGSGHSVTIVGWDDNYSADNFLDTVPGCGAWIIKNSWGESWGDSGYFYLSYYDTSFGEIYSYNMEASDNYDNIYQYSGNDTSCLYGTKKYMTAANVFISKGNETLQAVSFNAETHYFTENNYIIRIYSDVQPGDPTSGELVHTQRGASPINTSYLTVELDKDIYLPAGTRYTVAVTYDSGEKYYLESDSYCYAEDTSYFYMGDTEEIGEMTDCFTYTDEYGNSIGNFIIRAFTDNYNGTDGIKLSVNNFPDSTFRGIVSKFDINNDGILSDEENSAVTELNIDGCGIKRLDGIENLTYLEKLSCRDNELSVIDVSSLSALTELHCDKNNLTAVNLEGTSVSIFTASENTAEIGSIKNYYSLYLLERYGFDASKANNWQGAEYNSDYIILENISSDNNTITYSYNCGNGFSADFALCYNDAANGLAIDSSIFPDDNFREYVKNFDLNSDGMLSVPEREAVTEINVDNMNINSLGGIELFENLESLSFNNNNVQYFSMQPFKALSRLSFDNNKISEPVIIQYDSKLTYLSCRNNNIPYANIDNSMEYYVDGNVYDLGFVGEKYELMSFMRKHFDNSRIKDIEGAKVKIDVNNLYECYFYDFESDESGYVTVSYDCAYDSKPVAFKYKYSKLNIPIDEEHFPDMVLRNYVSEKFDTDSDNNLNREEIMNAKTINLSLEDENDTSHDKLKSLEGIEYLPYLSSISCNYNALETADFSSNTELKNFYCSYNELSSIDLTGCSKLQDLSVANNKLEHIDLTDTINIAFLVVNNNPLQELTAHNLIKRTVIYASNTSLKYIDLSDSNAGYLTCMNCTDLEYINIDNCLSMSMLAVDTCPKLNKLQIEGCKNFGQFIITNSPNLTGKIDLSGNEELWDCNIRNTGIEEIDISGSTKLEHAYLHSNKLKAIRADNCSKLESLDCNNNLLESLTINSDVIKDISCEYNNLTSIDLTGCTALKMLDCSNNMLSEINMSECTALEYLDCDHNPLVHIDLSNTKITDCYIVSDPFETSRKSVYSLDSLSKFGFDPSKASEWIGADYNKETNSLTNFTSDTVQYTYKCGNEITAVFTLKFIPASIANVTVSLDSVVVTYSDSSSKSFSFAEVTKEIVDYMIKTDTSLCIDFVNAFSDTVADNLMLTDAQMKAIEAVLEHDYSIDRI